MKIDLERLREKKMRPREARRGYETPKWTPRGAPREVKRVQRAPKIIDEGARCLIPCAAHRPPHRRERKHNDGKCKSMAATASIQTFVNKAQGALFDFLHQSHGFGHDFSMVCVFMLGCNTNICRHRCSLDMMLCWVAT